MSYRKYPRADLYDLNDPIKEAFWQSICTQIHRIGTTNFANFIGWRSRKVSALINDNGSEKLYNQEVDFFEEKIKEYEALKNK